MAVAAAVSGRRQRSGSGSGGLAGLPQPSRRTWVQPRSLLLHLAILAAASLGSALLASSPGRSRSSAVVPAAAATSGIAPGAPAPAGGAVRLAVVAPLQQASPFSGASWREVLEHTGQRLAWTDAAFQLVLHDASSELDDPAAAAALAADLKRCQAAVAIGVTDATEAATLAPLLAGAPTALALGSAPALAGATRLGGRVPGQPGGLPDLLASLLPGAKQAKLDAQVNGRAGTGLRRGWQSRDPARPESLLHPACTPTPQPTLHLPSHSALIARRRCCSRWVSCTGAAPATTLCLYSL